MRLLRTSPLFLCCLIAATSSFAVTNNRDAGVGGVVLRANVPMGTVVGTGDRVSFEYQTREDAAVLVFNIDSQGYVHLLYPSAGPEMARALQTYVIPEEGADLVVDSQTGVEFVFALAVDDPSAIDTAELDHLRGTDARGGEPYRIDGDPFVAANMIAGELVRGISHRATYFGYTYFYVNERVEYPCYLCGGCDGTPDDPACTDYRVVQTFDRRDTLSYPLKRAYDTVADVATDDGANIEVPQGSDVDVNFYPYGVEARAVDPFYTSLWNDSWWYDPFYWYGPYYPYYGPGWSFSVGWGGWGWGWGWWGGYYCSGWYAPCGGYNPWCGSYGNGGGYSTPPAKFKNLNNASTLAGARTVAASRDGQMRIASKEMQQSLSRPGQSGVRSKSTGYSGGTKGAIDSPHSRPKTSIGGHSSGKVKSYPYGSSRGGASSRMKPGANSSRSKGVGDVQRGGGGYKSRSTAPNYRGGSRSNSGRTGSAPSSSHMRSAPQSRSYSAPSARSGGAMKGSAPRSSMPSGGSHGASHGGSRGRSK